MPALNFRGFHIHLIISFPLCSQPSRAEHSPGQLTPFVPSHSSPNCQLQAKYEKCGRVVPAPLEASSERPSSSAFLLLVRSVTPSLGSAFRLGLSSPFKAGLKPHPFYKEAPRRDKSAGGAGFAR